MIGSWWFFLFFVLWLRIPRSIFYLLAVIINLRVLALEDCNLQQQCHLHLFSSNLSIFNQCFYRWFDRLFASRIYPVVHFGSHLKSQYILLSFPYFRPGSPKKAQYCSFYKNHRSVLHRYHFRGPWWGLFPCLVVQRNLRCFEPHLPKFSSNGPCNFCTVKICGLVQTQIGSQ